MVPKPIAQGQTLSIDENIPVVFSLEVSCFHEWTSSISPPPLPYDMSLIPWYLNFDITSKTPAEDKNVRKIVFSRPDDEGHLGSGGIIYFASVGTLTEGDTLDFEAGNAEIQIAFECNFAFLSNVIDVQKHENSQGISVFVGAASNKTLPKSVGDIVTIYINNVNEAPAIVINKLSDAIAENPLRGTIVAEFSCVDDPEIAICGGCEQMAYGCSLNSEHTQFGSMNCGDFLRAFRIINDKMEVSDEQLLNYENIVSSLGDNVLPITVKITDDGHGNCANVKGGSMSSAMTTFYLTVTDINERPTSVNFRCTKAMVALGPFEGCVSESFELDVTKLEVGYILGEFYASDPDAQDTLTYWLRESIWTSRYFHIYNGNKLRVKSIDFEGTSTPFISIEYFVVDSAGLRFPIFPTNMMQQFTLRFPLCAAKTL